MNFYVWVPLAFFGMMIFLFVTVCAVKYFIHTAHFKKQRDRAYFVLAKEIGEDKAATEIAAINLDASGFEEQEILESNMLEEEREQVGKDITKAVDQYRKYA